MPPHPPANIFNCLIRTHHITSRKKLQRVRRAADQLGVTYLLVRTGGSPGIMFGEAHDPGRLSDWIAAVQGLRYLNFRCVAQPREVDALVSKEGFEETGDVNEFAGKMRERGVEEWWKKCIFGS